jgi:phosphohistidine phosphatase SixA
VLTRHLSLLVMLAPTLGCSAPEAPKPTCPRQVLLIRHAEKPDDERETGLSPVGKKRAAALPELFRKSDARPDPFPTPDFIIAAAASKHSNRSAETVAPLAKALNLKVDARFASEEYRDLARLLLSDRRYEGQTVLVCWHHGMLPEMAEALKARDVPKKWPDGVFDRVWVITYENGEGKLARRPQSLLPGDSEK